MKGRIAINSSRRSDVRRSAFPIRSKQTSWWFIKVQSTWASGRFLLRYLTRRRYKGEVFPQMDGFHPLLVVWSLRYGAIHQSFATIKHRLWRREAPRFSGPLHLMISFLKINYRAKRLYGASVDGAHLGLHRLMTHGMLKKKIIRSSDCTKCWVPREYWNPHRHNSPDSVPSSSRSWSCGSHSVRNASSTGATDVFPEPQPDSSGI